MKLKEMLKNNKSVFILATVIFLFFLLPAACSIFIGKNSWRGIATITDPYVYSAGYYLARIKEIKDGYPFLGNPFFLEHNNELAPAFFVADWLAATPLFMGLSLSFTLVFNFIFWSLVFIFLAYWILRQAELTKMFSALGAVICYAEAYSLMTPVSMQTVYPFFLIFIAAFFAWHKLPDRKTRILLMIIASSFSFYVYTYLWQIILVFLFLFLFFLLLTKQKEKLLSWLTIVSSSLILSLPLFLYTWRQLSRPYYWETMVRIGFIKTHFPTAEVYYSGRWIVAMVVLWLLLYLWVKELKEDAAYKKSAVSFSLLGVAMLAVSVSNVITGKELELAQHVVRFIKVWLPLSFITCLFFAYKKINFLKNISWRRQVIIVFLSVICILGVGQYLKYYLVIFDRSEWSSFEIERYAKPLRWLEENEITAQVIWSDQNSPITRLIPILTKHYVLFSDCGILHILSSQEVEERYLVSKYFSDLTQKDLEEEFAVYAGTGNAVHPFKTHNRQVKICRLLFLDRLGYECGDLTDAVSFKGEQYFRDLYDKYQQEIMPDINEELKKFQVTYFILENDCCSAKLKKINNAAKVYQDEYFSIYRISR